MLIGIREQLNKMVGGIAQVLLLLFQHTNKA